MAIKRLTITKLFGQFDYDIPLDNPEGIRIITGPNGYGKTMILKILDSFFNQQFDFFETLVFETIIIEINSEDSILIEHNSWKIGKTFYSVYHIDELIEKVNGQIYKHNQCFEGYRVQLWHNEVSHF